MNDNNISIKNELLYFKEDILKDIKSNISQITSKYDSQKDIYTKKFTQIESRLEALFNKILVLSNSISSNNEISQKIESLDKFRAKTLDSLILYDIKYKSQANLIKEVSYKLDSFINENILYSGIIGPNPNCKFYNFHQFIDYIISNITQLNVFKDKTLKLDYQSYKNKIDTIIEMIKLDLENSKSANNNYTKKEVEECEERIKSKLYIYDEKIMDIRLEINKNISNINTMIENIEKESTRIKNETEEMSNKYDYLDNKIEEYHKECIGNYEKLKKLVEDIEKKLNKEIITDNKPHIVKGPKIKSFLKKYIEGKVGIEDINYHKNINNINLSNINEMFKNQNNYSFNNSYINNLDKNISRVQSSPPLILKDNNNDYLNNEINNNNNYYNDGNDYIKKEINSKNYEYKNLNKMIETIYEESNSEVIKRDSNREYIPKANSLSCFSFINSKNENNNKSLISSHYKNNFNNNNIYNYKINEYISKKEIEDKENNIKINENNQKNKITKRIIESNSDKILLKESEKKNKNKEKKSTNYKKIYKSLSAEKDSFQNLSSKKTKENLEYNKNINEINKKIIQSMINGKNSYWKLSILNNNEDNLNSISPILDIKKMLLFKNKKETKDINSIINNKVINKNDSKKENKSLNVSHEIFDNDDKNKYNNLINIINYSESNISKIKLRKKNKNEYLFSEHKSTNSNNNFENSKKNKNSLIKDHGEMAVFQNKLEKRPLSNKKGKNDLILYDSFNNSNKNKLEIIAINQNQNNRSLKNIGNYNNKNKNSA